MSLRREWLRNNEKASGMNIVYTKSTHFIMPMVGYEIADFLSIDEKVNYLINCYIDIEEQKIVIVLDDTNDSNIVTFLKFNNSNPHFINSINEEGEIVLFYDIPTKYKEDFDIFLTSKYSRLTEKYKKKLVDVYGRKTNTDDYRPNQFDVIYPTPYKRKQLAEHLKVDASLIDELTSKLNMDYETYKNIKDLLQVSLDNIKEYVIRNEGTTIIKVNESKCEKQ